MAARSSQAISKSWRWARQLGWASSDLSTLGEIRGFPWSPPAPLSGVRCSPESVECGGYSIFTGVFPSVQGSTGRVAAGFRDVDAGRGSQRSSNWTGRVSFASLALESREDRRASDLFDAESQQASDIGYKVLGQYSPDGQEKIRPQAAFAVVQVGSHQFKVSPGDMIYTEKLKHADINDKLCLNKVLLLGSLNQTIIGRPTIPEAGVLAAVEEHALDAKVIIFKKKRRKNYRRTNGHRQELTRLRILHIDGIEVTTPVEQVISAEVSQ